MEANSYRFLGLAAEREACNCLRKSRLMLASNFLVGTRFNSSRFCFASKSNPRQLKSQLYPRLRLTKAFQALQEAIGLPVAIAPNSGKPDLAAIRAAKRGFIIFLDGNKEATLAAGTLEFKSYNVWYFDKRPLFGSHVASGVIL